MAEEQQWIQQLAEVEDDATEASFQQAAQPGVQAPPPVVQEPPAAPIQVDDDAPTEPAVSPRQVDPEAREWPVQLKPIQGRVYGPQEEPERYPTRFIMNDGQCQSTDFTKFPKTRTRKLPK